MKKRKSMLLISVLAAVGFLCSCGADKPKASEVVPQINCESGYSNFAVSGEEEYYFLCRNSVACWDGNPEHQALPLCKRPDCSHDSSECVSFVMGASTKLFYVDGNLYLFSDFSHQDPETKSEVFPLWKIAADGSSKERVLFASDLPQMYTVFQDMVYYETLTEREDGKVICRVLYQPLEGGEEKVLWESDLQGGGPGVLQGIGDKLYFSESGIDMSLDTNDPEFDMEQVETYNNFYIYDPGTGELTKNPEFNGANGREIVIRNVYDDKIFYSVWDNVKNELWYQPIDGEGEAVCLGSGKPNTNRADLDFCYTNCRWDEEQGKGVVKAYDHEGNLVQEIWMPHMEESLTWVPANEDWIFGHFIGLINEDGSKWDQAIVLIERSKLAEGKAEMIRLFSTE